MHPILIQIGDLQIRWYGVMIALAFLAGTLLGIREARRKGFDPERVYDLLFYVMIASLLGARLYYVAASNLSYFLEHPSQILAVWRGGLSLHGGLVGGLLAGVWFCLKRHLLFWSFADLLTPAIILGQAVGRGACVLNGCSFGKPTNLPWAIIFTDPASQAPHNVPLHPTQFYEMGTDALLFVALWNLRKRIRFDGQLFLIYAMAYAVARFILEIFRGDSLMIADVFPVPQVFSVLLFVTALSIYAWRQSMAKPASSQAASSAL